MFQRTTTLELLDPTVAVDSYGDDVETWPAAGPSYGAHLAEKTHRAFSAVENRWTVARTIRALLDPGAPLELGQRLRDRSTGNVYTVVHVYDHDESPVGIIPTRADLERITS